MVDGVGEPVVIPDALDGERVDRVVAMLTGCSRSEAAEAISSGAVSVGGRITSARSTRVRAGDAVVVGRDPHRGVSLPQADPDVEVRVIHVDADVIVVDKHAGQVVHPGAGHRGATLVSGLLAHYPELAEVGEPHRPGIVHRLDKGTSGLMVVARTEAAYLHLVGLLSEHDVERTYRTLVWGSVTAGAGTVDAPIGRSRRDPLRMTVAADGRPARTHYTVTRRHTGETVTGGHVGGTLTAMDVSLETGRTHQIRVHLTSIGHPVVADPVYGRRSDTLGLDRPFLHAARLSFVHPGTGEVVAFDSPLPPDLAAVDASLR